MQSAPSVNVRPGVNVLLAPGWNRNCLRLAAIGDSHFAGTNPHVSTMVTVPDQVVRDSDGGACLIVNLAVGGSTSAQALEQLNSLQSSEPIDAVLISTGTNDGDLSVAATRQTLRRNWLALVQGVIAFGGRPVISTIPTDSTRTGANLLGVKECNAWLLQTCQHMGVQVVNVDGLFASASTGRTSSAYHDGGGLHVGYAGENLWAAEIVRRLFGVKPVSPVLLAGDRLDAPGSGMSGMNLCPNCLFTDGAGVGSVASWSAVNGVISTAAPLGSRTVGGAEEFVSGHWLKLVKNGAGPSQLNGPSFGLGSYQSGDKFMVTCRIKTRNFGVHASWKLMMLNWGGGFIGINVLSQLSNDEIGVDGGRTLVWFGEVLPNATEWQPRIEVASNSTWPYAPVPEVEIAQFTVRNVSELLRLIT